jgi:hypothetical protein
LRRLTKRTGLRVLVQETEDADGYAAECRKLEGA